jgi:hypothetical protein
LAFTSTDNLYYGGRGLMGARGLPGWRWLDLRALADALVGKYSTWSGARIERVVYCTARIDGANNASGAADQNVYLRALRASGSLRGSGFFLGSAPAGGAG